LAFSILYSTGKRTFLGLLNDGFNAIQRYCLNNFRDGLKQVVLGITVQLILIYLSVNVRIKTFVDIEDAFDLFLGNYKVKRDVPSPFPVPKENDLSKIVRKTMKLFARNKNLI
jgi:hypothetical protein